MIIRAADERTVELCNKLIEEQGFKDEIFFTRETPFSAALRKSYKIGIEKGKPWTFCVDADVLLRGNSIRTLLRFAMEQEENVFEVQGLVHDKFFPWPRQAGNHLYRTSLLKKGIELIPEEGRDIRPESYVLRAMKEKGYPYKTFSFIVGLHDFEQYFFDIYRKSFVHSHKHLKYTESMIPHWKKRLNHGDKDYEVALAAFTDGILNSQQVYIDKKQSLYRDKFDELNRDEKGELDTGEFNLETVETILKGRLKEEYIRYDLNRYEGNPVSKLKSNFETFGLIKSIALTCSFAMIKAGNKLKNKIEKSVDKS